MKTPIQKMMQRWEAMCATLERTFLFCAFLGGWDGEEGGDLQKLHFILNIVCLSFIVSLHLLHGYFDLGLSSFLELSSFLG